MNPRYQAYLEDVEERKRQGLSPPPYVITPDGKMTFERFRPGQDLAMVDPTHHSGGVRLNAPGPLNIPSQAEQTFVKNQPVIRPSAQQLDPAGFGAAEKRGIERASDFVYWNNFNSPADRTLRAPPIKKKRVITEEDGKDTKIVETQTIPKGERTQDDIMREQFETHAAGTTPDLASLPFISDADAAGKGLEKKQDESGMWWWVDSSLNFIGRVITGGLEGQGRAQSETGQAQAEQAEAVAEGISNLFDTTAERDIRMRQRDFAGQRPMQDYQGALAGLIQPPAPPDPSMPGWGDTNLRDPAVLAYLDKQRAEATATQAEEDRIWDSHPYDVDAAEEQYKVDMAEIYKKAMQLSMFDIDPSAFVTLATKRMEQTSAFSEQRRLQKIQRGIYYTEDGKWDPPSSKRVAFNRAKKFGAGVKLASAISDYNPGKEKAKEFVNWFNPKTGDSTFLEKGKEPEGGAKAGWLKGTLSQGQGRAGTFQEILVNNAKSILYNTSGGIQGRFDAAVREHMAHQKPDPQLGYNAARARRSAEDWVIQSIMSPELLEAYTYTPSEGEEITDELIDALRKQGYIAIMTPEGMRYIVTGTDE